jgi:multiple sugar transport system permease protein
VASTEITEPVVPGGRGTRTEPPPTRPGRPSRRVRRENLLSGHGRPAILFLAPFLVLYVLFIVGPALYGLVMSF